ncbi:metabolite traffic protein EboE [Nocardiopsis sp. HUAS JQ3]|uniref:metabolite traffic protein EboE n=1 Tax=Nocardiopsis sp. HUAS JQ3 TaxID=3061629 RepID=UPI0023A973C5|nr:metabolite traffic protein EboE [Nocardiopsis sp. HUAS JQ3]WDZ88488.1 metabolite traffic protein EboE [Nocardiopsis sp. HUAS JQ3]
MRLRHPDGTVVHLAYCTNVHPAEDLDGVLRQIRVHGGGVREALGADRLGLGLWLPAPLARELAADPRLTDRLRAGLEDAGLETVTLNAFPYTGFHAPVVKRAVYRPDWTDRARLDYTVDCARVLARLLPDDAARGSVSTLPLAWREPWDPGRLSAARAHLAELSDALEDLARRGRPVRVGLEPEPGCVVETTRDAARLLGDPPPHLGVCLDTCHLATAFEEPGAALDRLSGAGLPVVKTQASAAVEVPDPTDPAAREALAAFTEDRFLHQTRARGADGARQGRDDLDEALGGAAPLPGGAPWRTHFHVPLHAPATAPLRGTTGHLTETLRRLLGPGGARTDHVEVETYTWSVLPKELRPADRKGLTEGIAAEVAWARDRLTDLGLTVL